MIFQQWFLIGKKPIFLLIILFFAINCFSQEKKLAIVSKVESGKIILRWMPLDYATWQLGNKNGFELYRKKTNKSAFETDTNYVLINKKPLKLKEKSYWENIDKYNNWNKIAKKILFGTTSESKEGNDLSFAIAMLLSNRSIAISGGMGQIFEDNSIVKGDIYSYEVKIIGTEIVANEFADTEKITKLIPPIGLYGEFADSTAFIKWNVADSIMHSAFVVERSDDGGKNYKSIQDEAILANNEPDSSGQYYGTKSQKLPNLYRYYHYRVKAITPFGILSEPSNVVQIYGYNDKIPLPVVKHAEINGIAKLTWSFPEALKNDIKGFEIFRAEKLGEKYTKINSKRIRREGRMYLDSIPLNECYYQVGVVNWVGKVIKSYPEFVQIKDTIAPTKPLFKSHKVNEKGILTLKWKKHSEKDLQGYSIYRGDNKKNEFSLISKSMNKDSVFSDTLALNVLNNKVYYTIIAYDFRLNASVHSDTILVKRPDIIPPTSPNFSNFVVSDSSIYLTWVNSSSEDLAKTILYRRSIQDTSAIILKTFYPKDSVITYKDKKAIEKQEYEYSLVAIDESNLKSEPAKIKLQKLYTGIRPPIEPLTFVSDTTAKTILVKWPIPKMKVKKYILYRQQGQGEKMAIYQYFDGKFGQYLDKKITKEIIYKYRISAIFEDDSESKLSGFYEAVLR
jgi:uncharacterized protein